MLENIYINSYHIKQNELKGALIKMPKYHMNPETGKVALCQANKRVCKFAGTTGQENHFDSKEEATQASEKLIEKKYKKNINELKKQTVNTKAVDFEKADLDEYSPEERGNILTFEAIKQKDKLLIGKFVTEDKDKEKYGLSWTHGSYGQEPVLTKDEAEKFKILTQKHPIKDYNKYYGPSGIKKFLDAGYKIDYLPNTAKEAYDDIFDGTFAPNKQETYLNFKGVITNPDGIKMEMNFSSKGSYSDFIQDTLKLAEQKNGGSLKADDIIAYENVKRRGEEQDEYVQKNQEGLNELYSYEDEDNDY